ncbi:uncharacterized protein MYCFIDRAFT_87921 [Pseudocercospora fijiensis CIRAD86]|uniref:RING-type domain-containing protein n=1 Tax=Pseudocercospora fijiensis (strain CIRAD86) TaxID=383855 RepID=M3A4V6_PSEFD|nr:uncharacterized protein MYCFIDRAFT_87921 [Pseudocercospora fijiensis CIRAD86]EME79641.1 hypothetical protein MYCFIDRAFT_87921 [Pseudocercospora fijiensis CIRAD86]
MSHNRLSSLWTRPADDDDDEPERSIVDTEPSRSATLVRRTRSRFHEMLHRNSSHASSRPSLLSHLPRNSYMRSAVDSTHDDHGLFPPPRLPSIGHSSSFENDMFSHQPPDSDSAPRSESSHRTQSRRLNVLRPDRPFRHLASLRRRRSPDDASPSISSVRPSRNEDQAAMLSRLLSVAAAATAATLMGDDHNALREARSLTGSTGLGDLSGSGEDGSFDGFLRALQNGRIASALRQGSTDSEGDAAGSNGQPLNFFRMFRFGPSPVSEGHDAASDSASANGDEGRLVPIIIVGIRSISPNSSSGSGTGSPGDDLPPFIDALGNFPTPLPAHALGTHGHDSIDSILRPPQNGTSFRHRRRASMGGFGMGRSRLSDRMDDQRDHRSPDRRRQRPWSVASSSSNLEPRPPPATPASPSPEFSRIPSRNSTPNHSRPTSLVANSMRDFESSTSRRNSILHRASATSPLSAHTEETASIRSMHSATGLLGDSEPYRLHRRSDTAPNIHYPRFASGHPRRNGMVEPDHLPSLSRSSTSNDTDSTSHDNRNSSNDSRSWIIYVLGGSYPENHPILTTPSLFTENPTYEDMMLLSALLGPAKAPVATDEDVQSAGGIYTIESDGGMTQDAAKTAALVAVATEGEERVVLDDDQRCLVCLCDFETKEVARKLVKCNHLFHKECIDQWLTTGRNSCPLCREQGVDEKKPVESESENESENESDAAAANDSSSRSSEVVAGADVPEVAELEGS